MTSSDAPQPPGGPLRQDAPGGGFAPDGEREELASGETDHDPGDVPDVTREDEQPAEDAEVQAENAETSQDQPSQ